MRILLILGIPALAIVAAVAVMSLREKPPEKERVDLDPLVDVLVLEPMTTNFEVRGQGTIRPRTETILRAQASGTITSVSPKYVAGASFSPIVPLAVSRSFGIMFATATTLFLVPCLCLLREDGPERLRRFADWLLYRQTSESASPMQSANVDRP